jgi:hypothetical protein
MLIAISAVKVHCAYPDTTFNRTASSGNHLYATPRKAEVFDHRKGPMQVAMP